MKTVFSNHAQVAHVWAQQTQSEGRSPTPSGGGGRFGFGGSSSATESRVSFRGPVFYSYAEPVARIVEGKGGRKWLLYTSTNWSVSTTQHVGYARGAARNNVAGEFAVPSIEHRHADIDHARNFEHLCTVYRDTATNLLRKKTIWNGWREGVEYDPENPDAGRFTEAETIADSLRKVWAAAGDYADAFGFKLPKDLPRTFKAVDSAAADIVREREERAARALARLTPAELARREKAKAARAEKKQREDALRFADAAEKLAGWRDGLNVRWGLPQNDGKGGAFIRATGVKRDKAGNITGGTLQTSQGAAVPLCHAIRAFRFLKLCHDSGRTWEANGRTIRVGHFTITRVDASGDFVAGCHRINWPEVERLARALGVFELPPSETALEPSRHAA